MYIIVLDFVFTSKTTLNFDLCFRYEQFLMDLNPIPSYSLKLLEHVISFHPTIARYDTSRTFWLDNDLKRLSNYCIVDVCFREIIACGLFPVLTQVIEVRRYPLQLLLVSHACPIIKF